MTGKTTKKKRILSYVLLLSGLLFGTLLLAAGCGDNVQTAGDALYGTDDFQAEQEDGGRDILPSDMQETAEENGREASDGQESFGDEKGTESTAAEKEPEEVRLIMVGDMLMHMVVTKSGKQEDGSYNYDHLFTYTKERIQEADLALVNQEVILGGIDLGLSGYPIFNTNFEVGDALVNAGFDVVLHATNHTLDKGKTGVLNCLEYWRTNHPEISVAGIYDSAQAREKICIYERNGIRIAVLNYTYGTNGLPVPKDMPYIVNLMEEDKIRQDVEKAKELADFIVVCPHWGTEYTHKPSAAQKQWAEFFLDCGVNLVIGTHPHVIQPVELLTNEAGDEMLVYYSLGNYVNSSASEGKGVAERMLGAMAAVTIAKNEEGEAYISDYGAEPLLTYVSADRKTVAVYPMEEFPPELVKSSLTIKKDSNFSLEYCQGVWDKVFGE